MSILYDEARKTLTLHTRSTTYQMEIFHHRLLHLYYGPRTEGCMDYLYLPVDYGFSPSLYELRRERSWSLDLLPQEYSGSNGGDFRLPSLDLYTEKGVLGSDLLYESHAVYSGKYQIPGLPAAFAGEGEADTLSVVLSDKAAGVRVELLYGVFAERDVITRAVRITNVGESTVRVEKAASVCLDVPFGEWDLLRFHGRHAMERQAERTHLSHGIASAVSRRGISSHQMNPFTILCQRSASESQGECIGIMPVYSGSHRTDVELDQTGAVRVVAGINQDTFAWTLTPGETFHTPEVFLAYSAEGLTHLSHLFHRFLRRNLCTPKWMNAPRPVLLNNWEATYFDFNTEKLLRIAEQAKDVGVDLLVLDDGWFGARNDDNRALGDWTVNETKLPGGLDALTARMDALGLRFGLWIEPEMVSEDSDLYRAHPDWAMRVPGREPAMGRNQLVLDLARREVLDWLYDTFADLLRRHRISYIKWDMNRCLTDVYSHALPPDRQGEAGHRYVLGLYELARRLTEDFPDVLFEGCSGGGGRFDAGMLAYFPQIWCSDDTDAVERLEIQRGTSFGYPPAAMGAHVSAVPNHQTGRSTPLGTRAVVAMVGTFGYELDLNRLTEEERTQVRAQIARFREYDALLRDGDYYRLSSHDRDGREAGAFGVTGRFSAWEFVSPDKTAALASLVVTHTAANPGPLHFRWKGLDPEARYNLVRREFFGNLSPADQIYGGSREAGEEIYTGAALMYGGTTLPQLFGDYPSVQMYIRKV